MVKLKKIKIMAKLLKSYPQKPHLNRVVWSGSLDDMKFHLNAIEERIKRDQLKSDGTVFTEFSRIDDTTLYTCVYKNIDTEYEESFDINYTNV
jgi:hypothetical protein